MIKQGDSVTISGKVMRVWGKEGDEMQAASVQLANGQHLHTDLNNLSKPQEAKAVRKSSVETK